jgi:hypothetical protein
VLGAIAWLFGLFAAVSPGNALAPQNVESIVQRSIVANEADWCAEPDYDHWERDDTGSEAKTYQVSMIDGTPYERLFEIDDQPLSAARQRDEQRKWDKVMGGRASESPSQRAHRLAAYERQHDRVRALFHELGQAFEFTFHGQRPLGSRTVYVLEATPRSDYKPSNIDARALTGMHAEFWIDTQSYHWAKVTARVHRPISFFGVLMRLEPGTFLELEKAPVGDDVWLTTHLAVRSEAKILSFLPHRTYEDDRYYNYTKVSP